MSDTRANMTKARGLITYGSEISVAQGSQRQATNVNIDEDGVITPRRGFNDYAGPTTGVEDITSNVNQIMEYKEALLRQYKDKIEYEDSAGVFQPVNGTYGVLRNGYRTKWQESNSNFYFTSDTGIKKASVKDRASLNIDMITDAGGIKAGYAEGKIVPQVGGFLPPESKVGYRIIYGTKDANNNLIYGSPSSRFIITNYNSKTVINEGSSVNILNASSIVNGDYFTYKNSTGKYIIYFDIDNNSSEPKTSETIGGIYIKVSISSVLANNAQSAAVTANAMSVIPNSDISIDSTVSTKVNIDTTEEGDITGITAAQKADGSGPVLTTVVDALTVTQGDVVEGVSANVTITGSVPISTTLDYFYQVYRTGVITSSVGLTINDLDPGDEMNLVYESGLTAADKTAGEFSFTDNTPESFRQEAPPLYTNNVTGEGILQANEVPPIALDIELFRNYMFYANTKEKHRLEFTMLSIDDFVSDSTRFIVGNSDITRYYNFIGAAEKTDVTIDLIPAAGDYFKLSSAKDERSSYVYYGDSTDNPNIIGSVGYRVSLVGITTQEEAALATRDVLLSNVDYDVSVLARVLTITHTNNGYTKGITGYDVYVGTELYSVGDVVSFGGFIYECNTPTTGINDTTEDPSGTIANNGFWDYKFVAGAISIAAPNPIGRGELKYSSLVTPEGGDVLLSGLISVGQSIDETARSLVKIISNDPLSPVNAYYLSSGEDLPGNILLEARSLEDKTFYIAIEESSFPAIGGEFTPDIPYSIEIDKIDSVAIDATSSTKTITLLTDHGYTTGEQVFVGYFKDPNIGADPSSFSGVYSITTTADPKKFTITVLDGEVYAAFTPAFSTVYTTDVESDNKELPNRLYFSKKSEPEAVPVSNFIDIGAQDSEIKRILALRDNLFVLKDDGIFVVSGTSAPNWSVRLIDNTKIIAPDSAVVLNNQIYCLTEQGITRITGSGAAIISRGIEDQIDTITNKQFDFASNTFGISYQNDRAYVLFTPSDVNDTSAVQAFRYNIFEQTWSKWEYDATCGYVLSRDNKLYLGNADRNYISQERKDNERTDFSDRNFSASISTDGVQSNIIEVSTLTGISVNDVILQTQEVTIGYVNNRLLKKMDLIDTKISLGANGGFLSYPSPGIVNLSTPYPHRITTGESWSIRIEDINGTTTTSDYIITKEDDNNITIQYASSLPQIASLTVLNYYFRIFAASNGSNMPSIMEELNQHLYSLDSTNINPRSYTFSNLRANTELFVDELNKNATITSSKTYKKPITTSYEAYIESIDVLRNQITTHIERPFVEGSIEVYKGYTCTVEWNPQHFGDPSALKQIRYVTIMFDQNNFYTATAKFASDISQAVNRVDFKGKGIGYWGDMPWGDPNHYWGGVGNDIPFRNPVPRSKQKCRYLSITFEHKNARESFRIVGISAVVRAISDRAYR